MTVDELTPMADLVLRIMGIAEVWGIEDGLAKDKIQDAVKLLEPHIQTQVKEARIKELNWVLDSCDNLGGDIRYSDVNERLEELEAEK